MLEQIISLITPYECLCCHTEGLLLCNNCRRHLPDVSRGLLREGAYAATWYDGYAEQLIHALKFERSKEAAKTVALVMHERLPAFNVDLISYVPTASTRVRMRGYDQAAVIARHMARLRGVPVLPLLSRTGQQRQVGQGRRERQQQIRTVYRARQHGNMQNKRILLIDDVITTGATLRTATGMLRRAGAGMVVCAAFAAARKHRSQINEHLL